MNSKTAKRKGMGTASFRSKLMVGVLLCCFCLSLFFLERGISSCIGEQSARETSEVERPTTALPPRWSGSCTALPTERIQLYFTEPTMEGEPLLLQALLSLLNNASKQICCAFYDLENEEVAAVLIEKHRQGLQVAVVSDSDYADRLAVKQCIAAGIPVVFDERNALMHNKFCIVDGHSLWTGSTNITYNGFYKNNNNAIMIQSKELAVNFINEFEEMFLHRSFGAISPQNTVYPLLEVAGIPMECYFAPEDQVAERILDYVNASNSSIDFMAFSFTSVPIAEAMVERMGHGVAVRGLFERRNTNNTHSRHQYLADQGAEIYLDNNPNSMHHKVIIVDRLHVITGSYNFSRNAETRNDENVLILTSSNAADCFIQELEKQLP